MHPRKCARWVGLSLISLSLVCILANALLLVPDGKTWSSDQLSLQVLLMPGFIGGGLMVLCLGIALVREANDYDCPEWCLPICFIEGLLGAIYCLTMSAEGLRIGPKCSINGKWDYHFQRDEYLSHPDDWNICEEPSNVVSWNVTLFSLLVVVSSLEILLIFSGYCFTCIAVSDEPRSNPF
ncbi:transmembrane 4 L6 family member 5-like isoform X1 [Marmota flaviventris]|uniref:transmembrane 4 L6 family member 5-like isoform X1 n=1 Tax=Marmota flaviventris TaxID=93162 RepID=UPI003A874E45